MSRIFASLKSKSRTMDNKEKLKQKIEDLGMMQELEDLEDELDRKKKEPDI